MFWEKGNARTTLCFHFKHAQAPKATVQNRTEATTIGADGGIYQALGQQNLISAAIPSTAQGPEHHYFPYIFNINPNFIFTQHLTLLKSTPKLLTGRSQ